MKKNYKEESKSLSTMEVVLRFNQAFDRHDVDAVMAAMTDDCVFENTSPAPDGARVRKPSEVSGKGFFGTLPMPCLRLRRCLPLMTVVWYGGFAGRKKTANRGTFEAWMSSVFVMAR